MKKTVLFALVLGCLQGMAQEKKSPISVSEDKKIILSVNGGLSYRLESIQGGFTGDRREHMKNLKLGYNYQASAYYMFNYLAGLGLEYSSFKASDTMPGEYNVTAPNGQTGTSKISDDVTISFIGAGFIWNLMNESRQKFYLTTSFGYLQYKDDAYFLGNYKITGSGLGASVGVSYQYLIINNLSVGPKLNFSGSSIRKFTYEGPDGFKDNVKYGKDNTEHYTRLDLGVQVMYRF